MSFLNRQDLNLIDYLRIIMKRRMVVIVTTAIVLVLVAIQTYKTPKIYNSSAKVYIEPEEPLVEMPNQRWRPNIIKIDTEMEIIKSRDVAKDAVLNKLNWASSTDTPGFEGMVKKVQGSIRTLPIRGTTIVRIIAASTNPKEAQQVANAVAHSYPDVNFQSKLQQNQDAMAVLKKNIEAARIDWQENEMRLVDWKKKYGVLSKTDKNRQQDEVLHGSSATLYQTRRERIERENAYQALRRWFERYDLDIPPPGIAKSDMANRYYQDLVTHQLELDRLREIYLDRHPKVQEEKRTVDNLNAEFRIHLQQLLEQMRAEVTNLRNLEAAHERQLASESNRAIKQSEKDYEYTRLEREMETSYKMYTQLLEKEKELEIYASLIKNNIRIVELAPDPGPRSVPVAPNWRFNMLIALALGMVLGTAGAFFLEYIDKTFKTPDELEKYLGVPVLGVIPKMTKELYKAPYSPPELLEQGEVKS